jgi:hypothetical protein
MVDDAYFAITVADAPHLQARSTVGLKFDPIIVTARGLCSLVLGASDWTIASSAIKKSADECSSTVPEYCRRTATFLSTTSDLARIGVVHRNRVLLNTVLYTLL